MSTTISSHPRSFEAALFEATSTCPQVSRIEAYDGDSRLAIFLGTPALCDDLIKAAVEAKRLLLGEEPRVGPALAMSAYGPAQDLAAAASDPANPYTSSKHGEFTATSAAEVAEGVEDPPPPAEHPYCGSSAGPSLGYICTARVGHPGDHAAWGEVGELCHRWPQESAVEADHLAPPAGYGLKAIEVPADGAL